MPDNLVQIWEPVRIRHIPGSSTITLNWTGMHEVLGNLNKEIKQIEGRTKAGMWQAGQLVKRDALPITPKQTGHLRNSCYVNVYESAALAFVSGIKGPVAEIGYTAEYAPIVHETPIYHPTEPGTQWKFLETALKNNTRRILEIIRERARTK